MPVPSGSRQNELFAHLQRAEGKTVHSDGKGTHRLPALQGISRNASTDTSSALADLSELPVARDSVPELVGCGM